jgi:hypothetical protein
MQTHTEISRESHNLFSAKEVAETIGADLETVNEWLEVGAIDRAIFGGGQFSKYELHRAALVFELVKFGLPPSKCLCVFGDVFLVAFRIGHVCEYYPIALCHFCTL